ncbi:MAG: cellulose 1,4-beta-cellobiosidase, partial [Oscillospiraceae bacterium]|nr:cellulose 1,4-beta-cellobiosidase [Oscillospiraceae bacterium]
MQFKKNRAILSAVVAAAMASSALMSVTASAAGTRTAKEKYGDSTYAERFMSLYDDVYTNGKTNGYLSGDGVPYHSVEELICEAPDYGHETTSEAMSYIVWIAAMHDNLVKDGVVDGASGSDLASAWKTLEALIPAKDQQSGFFQKTELSAQVSDEHPDDVTKYPSEGSSSNTGSNPLHGKFVSAYKSEGRDYLLHWLADVDDWYGFGGGSGKFTFINTFQRGEQESCFETIPQGCVEELKYGESGRGIKGAFTTEDKVAEQYAYTNAPDAEERAIQGVYWANRWGVG